MKVCTKCGAEKDLSEFAKDSRAKSGLQSRCKECYSLYRQENIERINQRDAKYREDNRDKAREANRIYHENNKDIIHAKQKKWRSTERGRIALRNGCHKRRLKIKDSTLSTQDLNNLVSNATNCYWCGINLNKAKTHIDHYVPIKNGGKHELSNLVVSCSKCNQSKNAKDPIHFANSIGRLM